MMIDLDAGGEFLGYRIDGRIGEGGMGVVYRAHHEVLEREVALKVLAPWLEGNRRAKERFLRESRLAASLDHPAIVTIYDAGESDRVLYIAMQMVEGGDLHEEIERGGPLSVERTMLLVDQIAGGLDAAHDAGLVHRDVKPGNVLVRGDRAYLTDFGLTRRIEDEGTSRLTQEGEFMGTLDWASPEQLEQADIGPPADVYALGCVMFACLTGHAPFEDDAPAKVLAAHLTEDPPKATKLRPDLPREIDAVIERAMAKDASERYGSAGELAVAARAALGGEATGAAAVTGASRPGRP